MDDHDAGAVTDYVRERGRLSIKNEEEEEEYYERAAAGLSDARPISRNGVLSNGTRPSLTRGTSTIAAGMVAKTKGQRRGKPRGSGEYQPDDKRGGERALQLQRELSTKERETKSAKTAAAVPIAGGSSRSPTAVSNPVISVRTPHARKDSHAGTSTVGRGRTPAAAESTARRIRGTGTKRPRSPSAGLREGTVEEIPATKYGGAFPPPNPQIQPQSRRDQQQNALAQHGIYSRDFAQQQYQAHPQYHHAAHSQPIHPTADPSVAPQPQYAPNGTFLSRSATAPAQVVKDVHAQNLPPQAARVVHPNTPGNSSTTSSLRGDSNSTTVVCNSIYYIQLLVVT
jgi:hypothetical protein